MPALSERELHEFLTGDPQPLLKLATLTPDGWPYVVPVWYHYDGKSFDIAARVQNRWVPYVQADSRVGICIDTQDAPYSRVTASGRAEILDMSWFGDWEPWAIKYVGQEAGHKYYEDTKHIPRVLIRIVPGKFTTWTGGEWHPRYLP